MLDRSAFSVETLLIALMACVAATGCSTSGEGGAGGSAGGDGSTVYVPESELCGGQPCANHTGENDFTHPSAPDGVDSLFTDATRNPTGTNGANEPAIVYPSHETMFPINRAPRSLRVDRACGSACLRAEVRGRKDDCVRLHRRWYFLAHRGRMGLGLPSRTAAERSASRSLPWTLPIRELPGRR